MQITKREVEQTLSSMSLDEAIEYLKELSRKVDKKFISELLEKYFRKREEATKEKNRFLAMTKHEKEAYDAGYKLVAGIDEAGRGPIAGPVVAGCVILPRNIYIPNLKDSKQLSEKQRELLFDLIREKAVTWSVGIVDHQCIDRINILNATKLAMEIAVKTLDVKPDLLLIDAVHLDRVDMDQKSIIKGDQLSISIAAASIVAKVTRDRILCEMDRIYPEYGFINNKGYATKDHIEAIKKYGICPIHRISFTEGLI